MEIWIPSRRPKVTYSYYMETSGPVWKWRIKNVPPLLSLKLLESDKEKLQNTVEQDDYYPGDEFTFKLGQTYIEYVVDDGFEDEEKNEDKRILMQFASDPQSSGTFTLWLKQPPTESLMALFVIELLHEDGNKNICLDNILHLTYDKPTMVFEDVLDLDYLEKERFIHTRGSSRYLSLCVHIHYLRVPEDPRIPDICMSKIARSYMLAAHGVDALSAMKVACTKLFQQLSRPVDSWNPLRKEIKSHLENTFLNSFPISEISEIIEGYFLPGICYPLLMELLLVGIKNVDVSAKAYGMVQLISHPRKPVSAGQQPDSDRLCLKGNFGHVMKKKVPTYASWVNANVAVTTCDELVDACELAGWCTVQLIAAFCCLRKVTMSELEGITSASTQSISAKSMSAKSAPKKKKRGSRSASEESTVKKVLPQSHTPMPMYVTASTSSTTTHPVVLRQKDIKLQNKDGEGMVQWIGFAPAEMNFQGRVDCDGSHFNKEAGYSCVIRHVDTDDDEKIKVLVAVSGASEPGSSLLHELQGLECGWKQSIKHRLKRVKVTCDCTTAIYQIRKGKAVKRKIGKDSKLSSQMKKLINNIIKLDSEMDYSEIVHMYRGANEVANGLARLCHRPEKEYTHEDFYTDEQLRDIKDYLVTDANGTRYPSAGRRCR